MKLIKPLYITGTSGLFIFFVSMANPLIREIYMPLYCIDSIWYTEFMFYSMSVSLPMLSWIGFIITTVLDETNNP